MDWEPKWSPDGKMIAFVRIKDQKRRIYIVGADGSGLRCLTPEREKSFAPSWSPDGKRICFVSVEGKSRQAFVIDIRRGRALRLTDRLKEKVFYPQWSPDGKEILFVRQEGVSSDVWVMDAAGNHERNLTRSAEIEMYASWSPDGKWIAVSGRGGVWIMRRDGSQRRLIAAHGGEVRAPIWACIPREDRRVP